MAKNHGQEQPKVLTSDEMNYLIYRYLQECGFHHSAFTFAHESHMASVPIDPNMVPPAALVTFVQKGLQYMEAEANIDPETQEVAKEFSTLSTTDLLTKDIDELRQQALTQQEQRQAQVQGIVNQQQRPQQQSLKVKRTGAKRERAQAQQQQQKAAAAEAEQPQVLQQQQQPQQQQQLQQQQPQQRVRQRQGNARQQQVQLKQEQPQQEPQQPQPQRQQQRQPAQQQQQQQQPQQGGAAAEAAADGSAPMEEDHPASQAAAGLEVQQVDVNEGTSSDIFICYWSPTDLLLLTGSPGDPMARIWDFRPGADHTKPLVLTLTEAEAEEAKDLCAADWHPSGETLACGSFNGAVRVWRKDGTLEKVLAVTKGPLLTLKWQKRGELLLVGSSEVGTQVVDAQSWDIRQTFMVHKGATLDADWRDDTTFATCCNDGSVAVCKMGSEKPLKTFSIGKAEANGVRWDPSGELLASSGDDYIVRVWKLSQDAPIAVFEHGHEIYTIRWQPQLPAGQLPLLGTASLDKSASAWDLQAGREFVRLDLPQPCCCMCFSPDGKYVVGGGNDGVLRIWAVADGREVVTHATDATTVVDVSWCRTTDKVAFTTNAKKIVVLHLKAT